MRVKITGVPGSNKMAMGGTAYGGQNPSPNFTLNTGNNRVFDYTNSFVNPFSTNESIKEVPRDEATLEAEKGETLLRQNPDGSMSHFDIEGKSHSQGGTPLLGQPNDFIYSKTKKMTIKDPEILKMFGKENGTATPADLAKKYDLNKYQAIVNNPDSDALQKKTAQMMIDNNMKKLGGLAIVQESMKGFPTGIPQLGMGDKGQLQAKYGGYLPKAQYGTQNSVVFTDPSENTSNNTYIRKEAGNAPYTDWDPEEGNHLVQDPSMYSGVFPAGLMEAVTPEVGQNQPGIPQSFAGPYSNTPPTGPQDISLQAGKTGDPYQRNTPYGISNSDRLRMAGDLSRVAYTRRYPISLHKPTYIAPETALVSPEREIAASSEAANSQSMINALSQDGSRARSIGSSIQGQHATNVANILGRYTNENQKAKMEGSRAYAEIYNKQRDVDAGIANQQQEANNSLESKYRANMAENSSTYLKDLAQSKDNAAKVSWLNAMHNKSPFYIDPATGRPKRDPNYTEDLTGQTPTGSSEADMFDNLVKHYTSKGVDKTKAQEFAHRDITYYRVRTKTSPFNLKATTTTSSYAPNVNAEATYDPYQGYNTGY